MGFTYKNWTTEEDNLFRKVIKENKSYKTLCKEYFPDRTASSLQARQKILGLTNDHIYRKNFFDETFWDSPNLLNSFWAGTMAADAGIGECDGCPQSLNWEISVVDEPYMDEFIKNIKFTGEKKHYSKKTKNGTISNTVKIGVHSREWVDILGNNFNITPRKANRISIPDHFSEDLKMAWLIGYINGDGCIYLSKEIFHQGKMQIQFGIGFTSACKSIVDWITDFSNKKYIPIRNKLRKTRVTQGVAPYYHTKISGQSAVQMFIHLSQYDVPVLERKWRDERVLNFVKQEYVKHPEVYQNYIWNKESFIYKFLTI